VSAQVARDGHSVKNISILGFKPRNKMNNIFGLFLPEYPSILEAAENKPHLRHIVPFLLKMRIRECYSQRGLGLLVAPVFPLAANIFFPIGDSWLSFLYSLVARLVFFVLAVIVLSVVVINEKNLRFYKDQLFLCRLKWPETDTP
jgi:hypothetical protein